MRRSLALALLAGVTLPLAACSGGHSDVKVTFDSAASAPAAAAPAADAPAAATASAEPLGAGDVRVTSTDGSFVMALVGDSVRMQLSDSLRRSVRQKIDSSADSAGGIGGMIARSVSGVVSSAMGFVVRIPVQQIENVRYEDGQIRFETRGGGHVNTSSQDTENRRAKAQFSAADGARFVAAVKARQQELGTQNR